MDKPKPIRLKYIPTDMYAVRYFKEKPFIVPDGMHFAYSENVDFSKLDFSSYTFNYKTDIFSNCKNCQIDLDKLSKSQNQAISFDYVYYWKIKGKFYAKSNYNAIFRSSSVIFDTYEEALDFNERLLNPIFDEENGFTKYKIYSLSFYDKNKNKFYLPYFDVRKFKRQDSSYLSYEYTDFFYFYGYGSFNGNRIGRYYVESTNNNIFTTDSYNYPFVYAIYIKNLGKNQTSTTFNYTTRGTWGQSIQNIFNNEVKDEITLEEAKQSIIYTLIEHSFDRKTAGYPTCTIYLHSNTKSLLTSEEIAQITAKGFTIA
ncbi:MAG: hypothetical protein ACI30M_02555 [Muribaculaceae bacterium]